MIVHLRVVPGFWVAVEESRRPQIRSRPIVIGGLPHQRGQVREANLLAQRSGVRAGMALSQAYQQCPDAVFLIPDPACYEARWTEVCNSLASFTPLVEPVVMGQAVCDMSGCERRWGDVWEMAQAITSEIRRHGIDPRLGIASNRIVAELASSITGDDGTIVIPPGGERRFLSNLPLALLPDLDPMMALTFQVLGLKTIGQLAELPASAVRQRFGARGEQLHSYARGIDPRPVVPPLSRLSISARRECEDGSIEEALAAVQRLAEICAAELQTRHLSGKLITLTLEWEEHDRAYTASARRLLHRPCDGGGDPYLAGAGKGAHHEHPATIQGIRPEKSLQPAADLDAASLPVAYRIHSMLPQPGNPVIRKDAGERLDSDVSPHAGLPSPRREEGVSRQLSPSFTRVSALLRIPVDSAPLLAERAQRLLVGSWQEERGGASPLSAVTLDVSEFQAPVQLSFAELDRIDQSGALRGLDPGRLRTILQQEEILSTRYGDAPFRHVTNVDPTSVLTERRFRWDAGLSPAYTAPQPSRKKR
ncbi:MAG TPA: hypothetical protein VKX16_18400 [Chloroflexota bacterium]|nr:hypothetical protein [Chloroflexota bacterium]